MPKIPLRAFLKKKKKKVESLIYENSKIYTKKSFKKIVIALFQIYENYILKILLLILNFKESFINYFQQRY